GGGGGVGAAVEEDGGVAEGEGDMPGGAEVGPERVEGGLALGLVGDSAEGVEAVEEGADVREREVLRGGGGREQDEAEGERAHRRKRRDGESYPSGRGRVGKRE